MIIDDREILNLQDEIEKYRNCFVNRSQGTFLPKVELIGKFEKYTTEGMNESVQFFVSIPIKNQEEIIVDVIRTLLDNSEFPLVIGLLFDNCDDQSLQKCKIFFEESFHNYKNLNCVYILESNGELFESTCENLLFLLCKEKYFVSLQADIFLDDKTFLKRGLIAFNKTHNLLGVSGRAVIPFRKISKIQNFCTKVLRIHNYAKNLMPSTDKRRELGPYIQKLGYFGDISNMPSIKMNYSISQLNTLYIGDAIIRGPIIWNSEFLRKLNGFNDISYYLGRDDCDLCFRGSKLGYIVGYIPSTSYSIPIWGTTRKPRNKEVDECINTRDLLAASNPGELTLEWSRKRIFRDFYHFRQKNRINQKTISLRVLS